MHGWLIYDPAEAEHDVEDVITSPIWLTVGRKLMTPAEPSQTSPMLKLLFIMDILHRKFHTV